MSHDVTNEGEGMDRRAVLAASLAGALGLSAGLRTAAAEEDHSAHEHAEDHTEHAGHDHSAPAKYKSLIDSAFKCMANGEVCTSHCLAMFATGDTSLKDCIRSVQIMMPMCAALARAGALETPRLKEIAKLCSDVCDDCAKECKKHADHHAACKACMESCNACVEECKKII